MYFKTSLPKCLAIFTLVVARKVFFPQQCLVGTLCWVIVFKMWTLKQQHVSYQGDPGFVSHKVLNVSSSVFTKQKPIHVSSYTTRKNLDKFHAVIIGPCGFIVDFAIYVVQGQCECPLFSPWYS